MGDFMTWFNRTNDRINDRMLYYDIITIKTFADKQADRQTHRQTDRHLQSYRYYRIKIQYVFCYTMKQVFSMLLKHDYMQFLFCSPFSFFRQLFPWGQVVSTVLEHRRHLCAGMLSNFTIRQFLWYWPVAVFLSSVHSRADRCHWRIQPKH